jgi:hypothetical protein
MKRPIGSRLHGVLDYTTGVGLTAASRLPPLRGRFAGRAVAAAGCGALAYSLVTDYELGAIRLLPYPAHLVIDAVSGAGLAVAPWLMRRRDALDRWVPLAVGLWELAAAALSDPSGGRRRARGLPQRLLRRT